MTRNQHDREDNDLGQIDWQDYPHVERDPEIMSGAWCFEGTRLPVSALFTNLASGLSIPEFIETIPERKSGAHQRCAQLPGRPVRHDK